MSNSKPAHSPKAFKLVNNDEKTMMSLNTEELERLLEQLKGKKVIVDKIKCINPGGYSKCIWSDWFGKRVSAQRIH